MRNSILATNAKLLAGICLGAMLAVSSIARAEVPIATVPLFLTTQVSPNILLAVDDSGSMDGELLLPTNDGAAWWNTSNNSFTGLGVNTDVTQDVPAEASVLNFNRGGGANGTWKKFVYLFPNGQAGSYNGRRIYNDAANDHYAIPPIAQLAWARSSDFNSAYFNPQSIYNPWPSTSDKTFVDSPPSSAPYDPQVGSLTVNLTADIQNNDDNWRFRFFNGMRVEQGAVIRYGGGTNWRTIQTTARVDQIDGLNNNTSYGVRYFPATFYAKTRLPAAYGYKSSLVAQPIGFSPGAINADLYRYEIKPDNFTSTAAYNAAIKNFANWFTYYRKRHMATRGGIAESFDGISSARTGFFRINNRNNPAIRDLSITSNKNAFLSDVYSYVDNIGFGGTPNREAVDHAGDRFRNQSNIIQYACQSNAAILFTDGFSNVSGPNVGNVDGSKGAPYEDNQSSTIADIAMRYYDSPNVPLRTGTNFPAGRVPVPSACSLTNRDPALNCNRDLHMTTYAVTLGTKGILYDPDNLLDPYSATFPSSPWPTNFSDRSPTAVDDLWHATINGRGALLNANTPAAVSTELRKILDTILARVGSASSVAANSTRLDTDTRIFQAKFDSTDWSGEVIAYSVNAQGGIQDEVWSTDATITTEAGRKIFSWNDVTEAPINFNTTLSNFSTAQRAALGTDDTERQNRISWIRGNRNQEIARGGLYRNRSKLLGDVVNSDPTYVDNADFRYNLLPGAEGESYADYLTASASRSPMLLFGANDGMLHGLNALNGEELFSYIPGSIYPKLTQLTNPNYVHQFLVDATPRAGDAYLSEEWKTIVLGGTGAGGRSVFAIDVTDPDNITSAKVLWEISDQVTTSSPNRTHQLGENITQPSIVRLASGDWVAIFGNGYNSGDNVKLVVVELETGDVLRVIDTGVSGDTNGLGPVSPVDIDGDRITDFVYAGDLRGNLWKFDFTGNVGQWGVAYSGQPLITVSQGGQPQPITSRPVVGPHPDGGYMVYFGTGSYFAEGDNVVGSNPQLQRFYGVRDNNARVTNLNTLQPQSIVYQGDVPNFGPVRAYSDTAVNYASRNGWYLDLKYPVSGSNVGERVVSTPILRFGRIIFSSIIPSADPCAFGGTSWINELDAVNGSRLTYSVFDINNDGSINDSDFVTLADGTKIPIGGKGFGEIIKTPGIVGAGEVEYKYTSGSSGTLGVTLEAGDPGPVGRQSWRQLR